MIWRPADQVPALDPKAVHVWRASLRTARHVRDRLEATLSADELERADRFRFPVLRQRFVTGRGIQRDILARYTGVPAATIAFRYSAYGKPALDLPNVPADIRFNVSNAGDTALFALCAGREIGVDIEELRTVPDAMDLAERFFSPFEREKLRALPPDIRNHAFLSCWTRKEAFVKAEGEGLSKRLDSFDVSFGPGEPARLLRTRPDLHEASRWTMHEIDCGSACLAAVVVRAASNPPIGFDWHAPGE